MRSILAFALPALALALPASLDIEFEPPNPSEISIIDTAHSGNGCPQGTVSTLISDDRTIVTFGFDAFQVYTGPNTVPSDRSKNCQIHLKLNYPGGFQYSVVQATYHGYARLDPEVTGTFFSSYFFSTDPTQTASSRISITGDDWLDGNIYTKADEVDNASVVWSPCGAEGMLNINNRIALTSRDTNAAGELSNDDATVAFQQQAYIQWRPCTNEKTGKRHEPEDVFDLGDVDSEIWPGTKA
ncbi:hypothetical protein AJ80_01006 [Polytolypa hystricis UAMH7299]|uniref:Ubiquitin 3 binding protein But2 C-terminal domain-containing protein n=1 Tax=Polytolypa hystricis (strain UAMH7299) TaxID=1447883 RepID=A0A2B7Z033_POLH7|nr:hypothetical protein AJ80_01006 [Polytolypa hystricis UAMH7299]